ncbi:hypothetical protein AMAG_06524 [Allomyces macrogynus ATCC 38327]|uniref:Uncharacterized protein n=1 Tax=Allomyces macrogynus (strain ATCC 38327) TaxID=578462 RepID=A0A0L0SGT2_ALLM3|nr:hypothetical protein AMAG_06524 [Allomyces macrogynus ATCC 38327]|eukprot:KNE61723.1 hypothetical protein AMAG_06524 [Allomyces macrogynus ATCC 38327]
MGPTGVAGETCHRRPWIDLNAALRHAEPTRPPSTSPTSALFSMAGPHPVAPLSPRQGAPSRALPSPRQPPGRRPCSRCPMSPLARIMTTTGLLAPRAAATTTALGTRLPCSSTPALDALIQATGNSYELDFNGAPDRASQRAAERTKFLIWQTPVYVLLWPFRILLAVFGTFFTHRSPTEEDVFRFICNSSVIMLVRKGDHDGEYVIGVDHCRVQMVRRGTTQAFRSFRGRFTLPTAVDPRTGYVDVSAATMLDFTVNDARTTNPAVMLAALHTYVVISMHTKLHMVGNTVMRKIEEEKIEALFPSLEMSRGVHDMVLNSDFSPVPKSGWFVALNPVTRSSLLAETLNWADFTHAGVFVLKDLVPFAHYLWVAFNSTVKHTRPLRLDAFHAQHLFLHSVMHATDHYLVHQITKHLRVPIYVTDESTRNWSDLAWSACFRYNFDAPTLNPFRSNLMRDFPRDSVYGKIYADIRKVNQEWADIATASIMY